MNNAQPRRSFGKAVLAAWRQLCYKLTYHHLFSISLKRWIWALVVLPPLVALIGQIPWIWAILLSALGVAALLGAESARRKQYILFSATDQPDRPEEAVAWTQTAWSAAARVQDREDALQIDEPLRCWASGRLGVEGKARALAGERASISFVRTREHIVMAQVRRTRFLLLAPVSKADVGYWYAFFYPRQVQTVRLGTLYCGFSARPGLELRYASKKADPCIRLYLAFEDLDARQRLLDNLRRNVDPETF
jgi:hypothetical protein